MCFWTRRRRAYYDQVPIARSTSRPDGLWNTRSLFLRHWRSPTPSAARDGYFEYSAVATNKSLTVQRLWYFAAGRGGQEKTFAELRSQFALDVVPTFWRKQVELEVLRRSMSNSLPIDRDPDGDIPGLDEVFDGEAVDFVTHAVPSLAPSDDLL